MKKKDFEPASAWRFYFLLSTSLLVLGYITIFGVEEITLANIIRGSIIIMCSILPTGVYIYFSQERLESFFVDYRSNLRRLGLPENAQIYKDKAREYENRMYATYGKGTIGNVALLLFSPVLINTILTFIGWLIVFFPINPSETSIIPNSNAIVYGFLGAYVFGISSLMRQYLTNNLQIRYFTNLTVRYLVVIILSFLVSFLSIPNPNTIEIGGTRDPILLLAFVIGLFPLEGLQILVRQASRTWGLQLPGFEEEFRLIKLEGLNVFHEDRLLLEGIESLQSLISADVADLILRTRFSAELIIDWVDQAILRIYALERYKNFRLSGIRTATDFLDVYEGIDLVDERERSAWRGVLVDLLNSHKEQGANNAVTSTQLEVLHKALWRTSNLYQIRYWRDHEFDALPEDIAYERTKADLKLMMNLPDEAIAIYNKLIQKFPNYYALLLYRGLAYASKGEFVNAIDDFNTVIRRNRTNTDWDTARQAYLYRGRAQLALGDYNEAAKSYSDALEMFGSNFPEAQMDLAVVQLTHLGQEDATQFDRAIQNLTAVVASEFNVAEALANRGLARYYRAKANQATDEAIYHHELEESRKDLERALRLKPSLIPFYINLAIILGEWGELREKEQVLTAALAQLEASPDDNYGYRIRLERGYLFTKQKRYSEAIADFEIATKLTPDQPTAFFYLGTALEHLKRYDEAQKAFRHATDLDPTLLPAYKELGDILLLLQQYEEAKLAYISLLELARASADRPAEARAHLGLGQAYRQMDAWVDAKRELETAVNLTGDNQAETYAQSVFELGMIALVTQQNDEAVRHFTDSAVLFEVYGDARASANAYHYLGQAQMKEKQYDEAREALKTAQQCLNAVFVPDDDEDQALQENIQRELAHLASFNGQSQPISDG